MHYLLPHDIESDREMPTTVNHHNFDWMRNALDPDYRADASDPVECLIFILGRHALDSKFEEYGNFVDTSPGDSTVRFWGNFSQISAGFSVDSDDPEVIGRLTRAIRNNQASSAYAEFKTRDAEMKERGKVRRTAEENERRLRHIKQRRAALATEAARLEGELSS